MDTMITRTQQTKQAVLDSVTLPPTYTKHQQRVAPIIGIDTKVHAVVDKLKERGFHAFVDDRINAKFKYKAGILGSHIELRRNPTFWSILAPFIVMTLASIYLTTYTLIPGTEDFPYWALMIPVDITCFVCLAIYGVNPTREVRVDYVGDIPDFVLDNMEKSGLSEFTVHSMLPLPVKETQVLSKTDPVMIGWINDQLGVVIGMWDYDKEISLME